MLNYKFWHTYINKMQKISANNGIASKADFLHLLIVDIDGIVRGKTLHTKHINDNEISMNTDSSSIPGFDPIDNSDTKTVADMSSLRMVPEQISNVLHMSRMTGKAHKVAIAFSYNQRASDGTPHASDPRGIAKRYEDSLKDRKIAEGVDGASIKCGAEPEFYTLEVTGHDFKFVEDLGASEWTQRYFDMTPGRDMTETYRMDVLKALNDMGVNAEQAHHEVGSSQHEFMMRASGIVGTSDNVMLDKLCSKSVARIYEWYASFMPKVREGFPGNGMHLHISMWDREGKENLMIPENEKEYFSELGASFVAGVLHYAPVYALIAAPTVNSYKRLVPHQEAPTIAVWDTENRSAMIRRPGYAKGNGVRFELRFPDTSANPYLVYPVVVEAGLRGIAKKMHLDPPIRKNVYSLSELSDQELDKMGLRRLPANLGEAIEEARKDKDGIIEKALGKEMFQKMLSLKAKEWEEYVIWCRKNHTNEKTKSVTKWEVKRYLYL